MAYKPVLTKKDFVRRYAKGEFGNHSPTWNRVSDWAIDPEGCQAGIDDPSKLYHLRNKIAGGKTYYDLTSHELVSLLSDIVDTVQEYYVSEMCPTAKTILQGEVQQSTRHLTVRYTKVAKPMRQALATKQEHAYGLEAKSILQSAMCPNSWEWLCLLLRRYCGHVIEFTTFSVNWGTLPNFNTVIWEVRNY